MIAYRGVYTNDLPLPDEALSAFFAAWTPAAKRIETVPLRAALGRVLACDVRSDIDVPEDPRSAMDGFAVLADDLRLAVAARPRVLALAGEVRPGSRARLPAASALRIATGAPLPLGADAVVRVEDVFLDRRRGCDVVCFLKPVSAGTDVIAAGEDVRAGTTLARAGTAINAALAGVLATLGHELVDVYRRPSVALVTTGDEVVPIGTTPRAGEVRNSNAVALAALLDAMGMATVTVGHVRDDVDALLSTIAGAVQAHDAVVVSGGSSVGARDLTTATLSQLEPPGVVVHGVRMKPGRPVLLAASGSRPIIGLPGNPTAAMLALMTFGPPIFAKLHGGQAAPPSSFGIAAAPLAGKTGWACFVPVRVDSDGAVRPVEHFCSTFVSSLVAADGYVHVDAGRSAIAAGEPVRVYRLP